MPLIFGNSQVGLHEPEFGFESRGFGILDDYGLGINEGLGFRGTSSAKGFVTA